MALAGFKEKFNSLKVDKSFTIPWAKFQGRRPKDKAIVGVSGRVYEMIPKAEGLYVRRIS